MELKEQLRAIYKEYARQTGEIIGVKPEYWCGNEMSIDACMFCDVVLDMSDMQELIDHMDKWLEIHGTTEAVADEVFKWYQYIFDHPGDKTPLCVWLKGNKPDDRAWEMTSLGIHIEVLKQVEKEYPTHSVSNVIMQMEARMKELVKQKNPNWEPTKRI